MSDDKSLAPKNFVSGQAPKNSKLQPWATWQPQDVFPLEKGSRAGVVVDKDGSPQMFVFDTKALLDLLSTVDEQLADRLSDEDYHNKKVNPSGWLIDEIEARMPVSDEYAQTLKDAIEEAEEKGWVPFDQVKSELDLL